MQLLRDTCHLPVDDLAATVSAALTAWSAGAPQHDDLTFVVAKIGAAAPPYGLAAGRSA